MAEFENLSGLAGEIRSSLNSDQFDLGGYNEQRVKDLMVSAFSKPLSNPKEMVRFSFIVGGGKLVRSRYAEELPKWITSSLREVGFSEDRSAAETFDSQGTFKQQHDTGQNLKYIIVYPRVLIANVKNSDVALNESALVDTSTPEYILKTCTEMPTFSEIVLSKTQSWRQRKRVLKCIQDGQEQFKTVEEKLISGAALNPFEQNIYDSNSGNDTEKIQWLQNNCKEMVDNGKLTQSEKDELLASIDVNIKTVTDEIEKSNLEGKNKKVEKLQEKKNSLITRKSVVENLKPIFHRLKYSVEIQKLRVKILSLSSLEEKARNCSLTIQELKSVEEKSDFEERIKQLETSSRGWFEEDENFLLMCELDANDAKTKYSQAVKKTASSGATNKSGKTGTQAIKGGTSIASALGGTAWVTASRKTSSSSSYGTKKETGGSSSFAAAFGDSDSD